VADENAITGLLKGADDFLQHGFTDPPWILELLAGGALGAAQGAAGGPVDTSGYWLGRNLAHRRRALQALAQQMGIDPKKAEQLPADFPIEALFPSYQMTRQGQVVEFSSPLTGKPPEALPMPGLMPPPPRPLTLSQGENLVLTDEEKRQLALHPPGKEKPTKPERPQFIPPGARAMRMPDGTIVPVPPEALAAPKAGALPEGSPKDLGESALKWNGKGITLRFADGSRALKGNAYDALQKGAVPFRKDDDEAFVSATRLRDRIGEMLDMLPGGTGKLQLKPDDFATLRQRVSKPGLIPRLLGQKAQEWEVTVGSKDSPALARYIQLMRDVQFNAMKTTLWKGRVPVYDQMLLIDKVLSPQQSVDVQRSQLQSAAQDATGLIKGAMDWGAKDLGAPPPAAAQTAPSEGTTPSGNTYRILP